MCTTCITVDYLTIQDKTEKGCCTFNQNLTTTLIKLINIIITRNATRYNNRDDLLHVSSTLKTSIFSVAYI